MSAVLLLSALLVASPASAAEGNTSVIAWGRNTWGEADIPTGLAHVRQISATAHSMVLLDDGTVRSWGHDKYGETDVPTGLSSVTQIAAGGFHSMALSSDSLVAWGQNQYGQADVPAGLHDIVAISGGRYHSLVLHGDGTVTAWGDDEQGQSSVPPDLDDVVAIDGGGYHSLALRGDGTVVAWGSDASGQSTVPEGLHDVIAVAAGWDHSVALRSDGTVVAWGSDELGQSSVPADLPPVASISAGATHTLVALQDGRVATWGDNTYGVIDVPAGVTGATQVTGKAMHSMVLGDDPVPSQVRNLRASVVSNAKVTLNWSYPDGVTDHDVVQVVVRGAAGEVAPASVGDGVLVPTGRALTTSATDPTGLEVGQRYSYSVFAVDAAGNVGDPASITVPVVFPGAVTAVAASAVSGSSVSLSWVNPDDDQLKRIIVRRAAGGVAPASSTSGSNVGLEEAQSQSVTDSGLAAGSTYSYAVFAQDRIGNISPLGSGSTITVSTAGATPPAGGGGASVRGLTAPIVTNAKVTLRWEYPSGTKQVVVRGAAGEVAPASVGDGVLVPTGRALTTSATDPTGLEVGQRYSYSVFAVDAAGNVGDPASITVPVVFPGAVTAVAASAVSGSSVSLSWVNPDDDQLKRIIVRRAAGGVAPASSTSGSNVGLEEAQSQSVTDSGLAAGSTYSYAVFAQDRIGNISPLGSGSTITITVSTSGS